MPGSGGKRKKMGRQDESDVERQSLPIIRTKLYKPRLSSDLVDRPRLLQILDRTLEVPLTLVSAPAGYGKSVLVSQWAERQELPCAWLSLDQSDSELRLFLAYVLAAIETVAPDACPSTRELIGAPSLPPIKMIGGQLINELDTIDAPFVLILDDYHRIGPSSPVHELLGFMLENPPRSLHVVITARHDPPLPVALLWGDRRAAGIRFQDLKFDRAETVEFLDKAAGHSVSEEALANLDKELEGWAIGLRLLSLSLTHVDDPDAFAKGLHGGLPQTREYLFQEVLAKQLPEVRSCMLKSSILDRFCPEVLDVVFGGEAGSAPCGLSGHDYVNMLQRSSLFVTSIDARGNWFRYHSILKQFLGRQLQRELPSTEIAALHARASTWFESQGLIEESIRHALKASAPDRAAEIVARHRFSAVERGSWCDVERWLNMLPEDIRQQKPELLMARLLVLTEQYSPQEMPYIIQKVESLLEDEPLDGDLAAELEFHRGLLLLWIRCDGEGALRHFEAAKTIGSRLLKNRLVFYAAVARHLIGQGDLAVRSLQERVKYAVAGSSSRPASYLTFLRLLSGDLFAAARDAVRTVDTATNDGSPLIEGTGWYMYAIAELQAYRLEGALRGFDLAAKKRNLLNRRFAIDALAGRILTFQALDRFDDAVAALKELVELAKETCERHHLKLAESSQARLSLLQNDVDAAVRWADAYDGELVPSDTFFYLEVPVLTQCRAWIASGTRESLEKALGRLLPVRRHVEALHFIPQMIEVLVLQAVALEKKGHTEEAHSALDEAIALAAPRGFVRPFIEAGPTMAELLDRAGGRTEKPDFARHLLAVFENRDRPSPIDLSPARPPSSPPVAIDPLTNRQWDVLELLAKRLRDKEIAEALGVSSATVNQHLKQIYRKLGVNSRRKAVKKAAALGILEIPPIE